LREVSGRSSLWSRLGWFALLYVGVLVIISGALSLLLRERRSGDAVKAG
jgi:hypothetical protein